MDLIRIPKVDNAKLVDRLNFSAPDVGTLYLTPTHVIFVDPTSKKEHWILLMHVSSVEKLPITTLGCPLFIRCKHFLHITFIIPKERDAQDVYLSLTQLSQPVSVDQLYCFYYNASDEDFTRTDGWNKFDIREEYNRFIPSNSAWCETDVNCDYQICPTYSSVLYVPSSAPKDCLIQSSRFRSKGRLPVLTYLHTNQAAICRCSQPLAGFNSRCQEDEQLLEHIARSNPNTGHELYIVDTRPKINAMANRAAGKGYENENFYTGAKFHFFAIENIHVMRASLNKLMDACDLKLSVSNFLANVEASHWLKHVKSLLETSDFIATSVEQGKSVLVHCSDGWDRTAQTCSLACIQLDPYYRTIRGLQSLIIKDWLSFGHKFTDRCGHIQSDQRETAPVFTQFLDAIWQITEQHPNEFEFNENFLITLHDHLYSCQFGTFIGNSERERQELSLADRTYSLWAYIDANLGDFMNPFYVSPEEELVDTLCPTTSVTCDFAYLDDMPKASDKLLNDKSRSSIPYDPLLNSSGFDTSATNSHSQTTNDSMVTSSNIGNIGNRNVHKFLQIDTSPQFIKFWRGLYNRHERLVHPREEPVDLLIAELNNLKELKAQIKYIEGRINSY
ncbi:Myotubularin-related protein 7, partial [Fragariocoptes setiger]